ncbi:MAG: hypothetical protein HYV07_21605 [Deltaproteobacteria bacterium]|nr:hypothetical protein [Deltaproteobacteria bacterium]
MSSKPKRPAPKCRVCLELIPYAGSGRYPIFCIRHAPRGNAKRRRQTHAAHAGHEPGLTPAERRAAEGLRATEPDFVALEIRSGRSQEQALAASGVSTDRGAEVLALARERLDAYEGSQQVIAQLSEDVAVRALLELRARLPTMPVGQLAATVLSTARALEIFAGGVRPSFGSVTLLIPDPYQPITTRAEAEASRRSKLPN